MKRPLLLLAVLVFVPPALALAMNTFLAGAGNGLPPTGLVDGELQPCPPGFDCLTSEGEEAARIAPLPFPGDPDEALATLVEYLATDSDAEFVEVSEDYVRATFVRTYVKLIEDVELALDREARVFRVRAIERTPSPASGLEARVEELRLGLARTFARQAAAAEE